MEVDFDYLLNGLDPQRGQCFRLGLLHQQFQVVDYSALNGLCLTSWAVCSYLEPETSTLPETNIAPENGRLEYIFQGLC